MPRPSHRRLCGSCGRGFGHRSPGGTVLELSCLEAGLLRANLAWLIRERVTAAPATLQGILDRLEPGATSQREVLRALVVAIAATRLVG